MVLSRMIQNNPVFSELKIDQIDHFAQASHEIEVNAGHKFFSEGDELYSFYLVKEGIVDITIGVPSNEVKHSFIQQIMRDMEMEEIAVSTVREGDLFGWSAIIPPHHSTANAVATTACKVIVIDCKALSPSLDKDREFAYRITIAAAQTIRSRLRDRRIESLAFP